MSERRRCPHERSTPDGWKEWCQLEEGHCGPCEWPTKPHATQCPGSRTPPGQLADVVQYCQLRTGHAGDCKFASWTAEDNERVNGQREALRLARIMTRGGSA